MRWPNSLSSHLIFCYTLSFAGFLLVCFLILYWSISSVLNQRMDEDLREDIEEFSTLLKEDGLPRLIDEIKAETTAIDDSSVFIMLLDTQGNTLYSSNLDAWDSVQADKNAVSQQLQTINQPTLETLSLESQESDTRVIYGSLSDNHVMYMGESLEEQEAIMQILVIAFSFVFFLALPLLACVVWLITRKSMAGILLVRKTAQNFSKGNLYSRVNINNEHDEIQALADSFDSMANRIQALIANVREIADNMAHDLRSPLGRIRLLSESILLANTKSDNHKSTAEDTIVECDRLIRIIDYSLDIAEADAGVLTLSTGQINLKDVIDDVVDFYTPVSESRNISLHKQLSVSCLVNAELCSIQRLLFNLFDNALKYTNDDGDIWITLGMRENMAFITLKDNGVGIPDGSKDKIFDRFYRVDQSRGDGGCGLGLSYARSVARAHGGDITVASKFGDFTQFNIEFPLAISCNTPPKEITFAH